MNHSLNNYIEDYLSRGIYPFHMPGHKRNSLFLPPELTRCDLTEIPGMDNLHAPADILREMQEYIAYIYGADESFFLVNGSSAGIIAAICASCGEGDTLFAARNSHVSVYNGLAFSGASPVYMLPEQTPAGLCGGVLPVKFTRVSGAVLLTSPTYEGYVSDIAAISEEVHQKNALLIVDEAHGAHFPFHALFPSSAITMGADITINSFHKTLPALSQCAVLHVKGPRVDRERLRFYLRAVQTTSPSYLFMTATDYMLHMLIDNPEHFESYVHRLRRLRTMLPGICDDRPICLHGREQIGRNGVYDMDEGKLLLENYSKSDTAELAARMESHFKIQLEMATGRHMLAMTSVADTDEGFERLAKAISILNSQLEQSPTPQAPPFLPVPEVVMTPREALRYTTEEVTWDNAVGCISGGFIAPYPPGIPIAAPGERITEEVREAAVRHGLTSQGVRIINQSRG